MGGAKIQTKMSRGELVLELVLSTVGAPDLCTLAACAQVSTVLRNAVDSYNDVWLRTCSRAARRPMLKREATQTFCLPRHVTSSLQHTVKMLGGGRQAHLVVPKDAFEVAMRHHRGSVAKMSAARARRIRLRLRSNHKI